MAEEQTPRGVPPTQAAHFVDEPPPADAAAWEQIEAGRYMPRRIKGSCKGRALG